MPLSSLQGITNRVRVVVPKDKLEWCRSCGTHLENPFWNAKEEALVFPDWAAAVKWYLSEAPDGQRRLGFLVKNRLVPMTRDEFKSAVAAQKAAGPQ